MRTNSSLTDSTYERIRADLLACRLAPGQRLKTKELSTGLGVSLGVVREALSKLTAEGFVLAQPQRGFHAAPLSPTDLMQLSEAAVTVETACLRRAIEVGDLEWETRVTGAHYRFVNVPLHDAKDPLRISVQFSSAYSEFRRALLSACDNVWMLKLRDTLHAQNERYRQACMMLNPTHSHFQKSYAAVVEAALARNADRAIDLLSERMRTNARHMRDALQQSGVDHDVLKRTQKKSQQQVLHRARSSRRIARSRT